MNVRCLNKKYRNISALLNNEVSLACTVGTRVKSTKAGLISKQKLTHLVPAFLNFFIKNG